MLNRLQFLFLMTAVTTLTAVMPARSGAETAGIQFGAAKPFNYEELKQRARTIASKPYQEPVIRHSEILETIDCDAFQKIVFKRELGLGEDGSVNFPPQLFPPGRHFKVPVKLHVLNRGQGRETFYLCAMAQGSIRR